MIRQPRRGLQSIRTRGGSAGPACESSSRHAIYLKLAMLEIERERRAKEQVGSAARVAQLAQRITQIDGEVLALQKLMASEDAASASGPAEGRAETPADPGPPELPRPARVFRF